MLKYIVTYNVGYGDTAAVVEADSKEAAREATYTLAMEEAENNMSFTIVGEYTNDLAEEYGVEEE